MKLTRWILIIGIVACANASFAQQSSKTAIHVFGGWAYGKTDGNGYLSGTKKGDYSATSLSLAISAAPAGHLRIFASSQQTESTTQIDYAFGEWTFSDALRLRAGKIKHPFGISTEVYDVGTLRPFFSLPQSVYGPVGTLAESLNGVGAAGVRRLGPSWTVKYDAYFGALSLPYADFGEEGHGGAATGEQVLDTKEVIGARLVVETPIDGLSFGASAYSGKLAPDESAMRPRHSAAGLQAEYLTDRVSLRAEWTRPRTGDEGEHGGYFEAAYHLTSHWQVAARHEELHEDADHSLIGHHHESALGINYWVSPHFVVKLSAHKVEGLHLVVPETDGQAKPKTTLLNFGAQFSF